MMGDAGYFVSHYHNIMHADAVNKQHRQWHAGYFQKRCRFSDRPGKRQEVHAFSLCDGWTITLGCQWAWQWIRTGRKIKAIVGQAFLSPQTQCSQFANNIHGVKGCSSASPAHLPELFSSCLCYRVMRTSVKLIASSRLRTHGGNKRHIPHATLLRLRLSGAPVRRASKKKVFLHEKKNAWNRFAGMTSLRIIVCKTLCRYASFYWWTAAVCGHVDISVTHSWKISECLRSITLLCGLAVNCAYWTSDIVGNEYLVLLHIITRWGVYKFCLWFVSTYDYTTAFMTLFCKLFIAILSKRAGGGHGKRSPYSTEKMQNTLMFEVPLQCDLEEFIASDDKTAAECGQGVKEDPAVVCTVGHRARPPNSAL